MISPLENNKGDSCNLKWTEITFSCQLFKLHECVPVTAVLFVFSKSRKCRFNGFASLEKWGVKKKWDWVQIQTTGFRQKYKNLSKYLFTCNLIYHFEHKSAIFVIRFHPIMGALQKILRSVDSWHLFEKSFCLKLAWTDCKFLFIYFMDLLRKSFVLKRWPDRHEAALHGAKVNTEQELTAITMETIQREQHTRLQDLFPHGALRFLLSSLQRADAYLHRGHSFPRSCQVFISECWATGSWLIVQQPHACGWSHFSLVRSFRSRAPTSDQWLSSYLSYILLISGFTVGWMLFNQTLVKKKTKAITYTTFIQGKDLLLGVCQEAIVVKFWVYGVLSTQKI